MSKKGWISLGIAFAGVVAVHAIEVERTIEGEVAFSSDNFSGQGVQGTCPKDCYVSEMQRAILPRLIGKSVSPDGTVDQSNEKWWRTVPVDAGDEYYRISLETPKDEEPVELNEGDKVKITYKDSLWDHLENYVTSRRDHPYRTPIVDGVSLELVPE